MTSWFEPIVAPEDRLTLEQASRIVREATKSKAYRAYPLGGEAGSYLRWKRGVITAATYRDYESCLDKLARTYPDLELSDFEPPIGTERVEEMLDRLWGDAAPRTYNKNLSILKDFFKWATLRGKLHGDPTLPLRPHKKRDVHREIFSEDSVLAVIASQDSLRDRICLRLLFHYGLRKGALRNIQFKHFDHNRRRLTIFTKGGKVRELPIVDRELWFDLEHHIIDVHAEPHHFLLCRTGTRFAGYDRETGDSLTSRWWHPNEPMGEHGAHDWWYGCLERAGIVATGQTSGERMHKARHTAGQRILDATGGNLKATQSLLGHASIQTTGDIYTDWDTPRLEATLQEVFGFVPSGKEEKPHG